VGGTGIEPVTLAL